MTEDQPDNSFEISPSDSASQLHTHRHADTESVVRTHADSNSSTTIQTQDGGVFATYTNNALATVTFHVNPGPGDKVNRKIIMVSLIEHRLLIAAAS